MTFVDPQLRPLLEAARGQPGLADVPPSVARAQIAARTASRPRGPALHEVRDLLAPGPCGSIPLRLYRPREPVGVAVAFHGGGWLMGNLDSFDATCRHLANDSGLAVVSVDYRLAPEHRFPAAIDDAWAATQWLAANTTALGLGDSGRMVLVGESAGGNLAAVVALLARDAGSPKICLQVLVYPAVDGRLECASLREFAEGYLQTTRDVRYAYRTYGVGTVVNESDWRLSPLLAPSHANVAPAFIISAECDGTRDDSDAYTHRLLESGVAVTHVRYAGMIHTFFSMRGIIHAAEVAQKQAAEAMRRAVTQRTMKAYPDSSAVPDYTGLLKLDGRGFVVLGAGDGMGRQTCHALSQAGADVLCVDNDAGRAEVVAREVRGTPLTADVTSRADVQRVFAAADERFGSRLNGVVDVVGVATIGALSSLDDEAWTRQFDIVLRHAYLAIQVGGAALASRGGGTMVFVGSISGEVSVASQAAYGTAKAALHHLVRCSAHEFGPSGVRINAVAPGFVRTPRLLQRLGEEFWQRVSDMNPLRRVAIPAEIASTILFLSSDLARYVNGNVLTLDGGTNFVAALPDLRLER